MAIYPRRRFLIQYSILLFAVSMLAVRPAWAAVDQWTPLNLSTPSSIAALAVDPTSHTTVYVTTSGGLVHKSTTGGTIWTSSDPGLSRPSEVTPRLFAIAIHPLDANKLLVGADFGRAYASSDGGSTWDRKRVDESPGTLQTINALAFVPRTGDEAIAGTSNGIWTNLPNDIGHWDPDTSIPSTCRNILSVAVDPQDPNVRYAGSGCGLFKTAGGRTGQWTQIGAQFISASVLAIVIDPTNSDNVYAGTDGGGVFKVQSGGSGITNITTNNGISDPVIRGLAIHSQFSNVIYAATANQGIFKGRTAATGQWLAFNSGLSAMQILAIGASVQGDPRFLYAATADDVYGIEQSSVLPPPADLALSTRPPRQQSKGVFNYSIDVTNRGPNAIEYIKVYIEPARSSAAFGGLLDPPLTNRVQSLSFSGGICRLHSPNLISCARGPLASGASATLAFIVKSSTRTSLFQQPLIPVNVIGSSRIAGDLWGTVDPNLFNNSVKVFLPLP